MKKTVLTLAMLAIAASLYPLSARADSETKIHEMVCSVAGKTERPYYVSLDGKTVSTGAAGRVSVREGKLVTKGKNKRPIVDIPAIGDAPRTVFNFDRHEVKHYYDGDDNDADQIDTCVSKADWDLLQK